MLSFTEVEDSDAELILKWRINERVARFMATEFEGDINSQIQWVQNCRSRDDYYHWLVCSDEKKIGLVSIAQLDLESGTAHWGFYIGDDEAIGQGALIPAFLYNFLFSNQRISKLHTESFENNTSVLALHRLYGYEPAPSNNRIVTKNGQKMLLVAMDLSRSSWESESKFNRYVAEFPVSKWVGNPGL